MVERLCVMEKGPALTPAMLPPEMWNRGAVLPPLPRSEPSVPAAIPAASPPAVGAEAPAPASAVSTFNMAEIERATILRALEHTRGHRNQATELLGISIRTLRNKLAQYRDEGTLPAEFQ